MLKPTVGGGSSFLMSDSDDIALVNEMCLKKLTNGPYLYVGLGSDESAFCSLIATTRRPDKFFLKSDD